LCANTPGSCQGHLHRVEVLEQVLPGLRTGVEVAAQRQRGEGRAEREHRQQHAGEVRRVDALHAVAQVAPGAGSAQQRGRDQVAADGEEDIDGEAAGVEARQQALDQVDARGVPGTQPIAVAVDHQQRGQVPQRQEVVAAARQAFFQARARARPRAAASQ
jgi:hypothetical protein